MSKEELLGFIAIWRLLKIKSVSLIIISQSLYW